MLLCFVLPRLFLCLVEALSMCLVPYRPYRHPLFPLSPDCTNKKVFPVPVTDLFRMVFIRQGVQLSVHQFSGFPDPILSALDSVSRPSSFACFQLTVYVPSHHPPYTHTVRTFLHPATRDTYYDSTPREHEPSVLFMCTSIPLSVVLVLHLHTPGQHCTLRLSIHVSAFVSVYPFGSRGVYGLRARA